MPIDVPMRFEDEALLWTVNDVYSEAECASFIRLIEASSPTIATSNPLYRDQDRVIRDDPSLTAELFFQHKLRHEGCAVRSGLKYAMRSDVIYAASEPIGKAG
jgi:hypothetical protein